MHDQKEKAAEPDTSANYDRQDSKIKGCMYFMTHNCIGCSYNSAPFASVGNCQILKTSGAN